MSFRDGKFGRLTVREEVFPNIFACDCKCGGEITLWRSLLADDIWRHCGECRRQFGGYHGHVRRYKSRDGRVLTNRSAEFHSWDSMTQRCQRLNHPNYPGYGGRGIRVCERWRLVAGFKNFLHDMGPRPVGLSLDRIDVQGHYAPDNCRWADHSTQALNRRCILFKDKVEPPVENYVEMERRVEDDFESNPY